LKFKFKWVSREGREAAEGWPRRFSFAKASENSSAALQRLVEEGWMKMKIKLKLGVENQ